MSNSLENIELLMRLLDNDPQLNEPVKQNNVKSTYKVFKNKRFKLEKQYSHIFDTIKATETRRRIKAPPFCVHFKLSLPTKLKKNLEEIQNMCKTFFEKINSTHQNNLEKHLLKIEEKLIKMNATRDPTLMKHYFNTKEWKQISRLKYTKTPNIKISNSIRKIKITSTFFKPKYYNKNLYKTYKEELDRLKKTLNTIKIDQIYNREPIYIGDKEYTAFKASEFTITILPKTVESLKIPTFAINTLNKGLNYTPYTNTYPVETLTKEFETFNYKLLWQDFFKNRKPNDAIQNKKILPTKLNQRKPKTTPPKNLIINNFTTKLKNTFTKCVNNLPRIKTPKSTQEFYATIRYFKARPHLIIKPADKGRTIIIMHQEFYLDLGLSFLRENKNYFKKLETDPLFTYSTKINFILQNLLTKNQITKKLYEIIKPTELLKTPNLYFLPKIHKKPHITGRPICSSNGHPAENISRFLDHLLKPYATSNPLYLKDTPQLLQDIANISEIPDTAILFSVDIVNMYTNIPIYELIETIYSIVKLNPQHLKSTIYNLTPETVKVLLKIVLFTNHFTFNGNIIKQINGIAMGTPCACTITDIFICEFVQKNFFNWKYKPKYYKQYRDDSFGIWLHGETLLNEYLHHLNTLHKQLKFTFTSGKKLQYLDLIITLSPWNTIHTETYYKPTDTFQYLQADSNHPASTIQNIPKSQLLRHVRNCSTPSTLFSHASSLVFNLTKRLHNRKQIFKKFETLRHTTRSKALNYTRKIPTGRTPLIITYNKNLPDLKKEMHTLLPPRLKNIPPLLAFKIKPPLSKYIIRAKFKMHI